MLCNVIRHLWLSFLRILVIDHPQTLVKSHIPLNGSDVTISCSIESNPNILSKDWTWKHNGQIIGSSNMLHLHNVTHLQSGIYECVASNKVGRKSNSTSISVLCKSRYR